MESSSHWREEVTGNKAQNQQSCGGGGGGKLASFVGQILRYGAGVSRVHLKYPLRIMVTELAGLWLESSCECAGRGQALGRALYGNYRFLPDRPLSRRFSRLQAASEALMLMSLRIRPCLVIFCFGVIRTLIPILPIFHNNPSGNFN